LKTSFTLECRRPEGHRSSLAEDCDGMEVLTASFCSKHKIGVLVVGRRDGEVDVDCTVAALHAVARELIRAIEERQSASELN
jgi:hypothetical protein